MQYNILYTTIEDLLNMISMRRSSKVPQVGNFWPLIPPAERGPSKALSWPSGPLMAPFFRRNTLTSTEIEETFNRT